ncbi:hypothetical protein FACS1894172_05290 [Spirochaetia bacterium]|nr:hypothetical protein FACS1894164_05650 [Spirochaetia bacterium]GHU31044.1 hypothetical protein FACS1894172_05290 [Spirochaetia bacterium]
MFLLSYLSAIIPENNFMMLAKLLAIPSIIPIIKEIVGFQVNKNMVEKKRTKGAARAAYWRRSIYSYAVPHYFLLFLLYSLALLKQFLHKI